MTLQLRFTRFLSGELMSCSQSTEQTEEKMSLLQFHNITKEYTNRTILDGIHLSIERRERVALIGDNGAGKSTLLKIAMGRETPDSGRIILSRGIKVGYLSQNSDELISGERNALYIEKHHQLEMQLKELEKKMADPSILDDTDAYDRLMRQYERVRHAYEAMDGYTIESLIKKTLLGLGMNPESLHIPLEQLSGGERIRVALARILIESPDLLILDEPTNHLDLPSIEWLEDYLIRFAGGVLIVSHDRYFLDRVTTRTAELQNGTLNIKRCNYSTFIEQRAQMQAFYLKEQKNMNIRIRDKKEQIQNLISNGKIKQAKSRMIELDKMQSALSSHQKIKQRENLSIRNGPQIHIQSHGHISKEVAWGKKVTKSFGVRTIFKDIDFHIAGGERAAIIGPNGCGKTTLLKMLMREDDDYQGELVLGNWITYAYLGQSVTFEDEDRTVIDEIIQSSGYEKKDALKYIARFEFYGEMVNSTLRALSGGERVRVYLAELMLQNPHCLILDEPTNHLDLHSREAIENAVLAFKGTVIAVSHDRHYLNRCVNKLLAFSVDGFETFQGNYDAYRAYKKNGTDASELSDLEAHVHSAAKSNNENVNTQKRTNREKLFVKNDEQKETIDRETLENSIISLEKELEMLSIELAMNEMPASERSDAYQYLAERQAALEALYTTYDSIIE
jgi:ATP-binding cassette subfamily F protein 3